MKKSKLKKKSNQPISVIQRELWKLCRKICYERDKNQDGSIDCYTCRAKNIIGSNRQLGHMWPKAAIGAFLKYDTRILKWQCMRCNMHLGGQGAIFYKRMLKEEGKVYMNRLEKDKNITVKSSEFYPQLLKEYKTIRI